MAEQKHRSDYGLRFHRKQILHTVLAAVLMVILISLLPLIYIKWQKSRGNEQTELLQLWEESSFDQLYSRSTKGLAARPMDFFLLTIHGFSAYELAIAQINNFDTLTYIDDCIWALRKALLTKEGINDGRVFYVLGKAYYYKGSGYADLAVNYLEKARELSYPAGDISEYLGLAYAEIRNYRSSVEAFAQALTGEGADGIPADKGLLDKSPPDLLLLAIARSYLALDEADAAKAYLVRCIDTSRDSNKVISARFLLASVLGKSGDLEGAEEQFALINEAGDNDEAHYQLGELYLAGGNRTRARAEYRRAVRINPAHEQAWIRIRQYE